MIYSHPLLPKLKQLHLSGMLHTLELRAEQAAQEKLSPLEFLAVLLDDELERRDQNKISARWLANSQNTSEIEKWDSSKNILLFLLDFRPHVNNPIHF